MEIYTDKKIKDTELLVYSILEESERARNSDNFLILKYMEYIGHDILVHKITRLNGTKETIIQWNIKNINDIPCLESITRARRKIQAGGQYLPTDPEVRRQRRIKEELYKQHYR